MSEPTTEVEGANKGAVLTHVSPKEGPGEFSYYSQELDGTTNVWDEMLRRLGPNMLREISGLVYGQRVVWSDEKVPHRLLAQAIEKDYEEKDLEFQSKFGYDDEEPTIKIFSFDENVMNKFESYLKRNINPTTAVVVTATRDLAQDPWGRNARVLSVGTGGK